MSDHPALAHGRGRRRSGRPAVRARRRDPRVVVQPAEPHRLPARVARRPRARARRARVAARDPPRRLDRRGHASGPRRRRRCRPHVGGRQWLRATARTQRSRTRASRRGSTSRPIRAPRWCRPGRSCPGRTASTTRCSRPTTAVGWRRRAVPSTPTPGRLASPPGLDPGRLPDAVRGGERARGRPT